MRLLVYVITAVVRWYSLSTRRGAVDFRRRKTRRLKSYCNYIVANIGSARVKLRVHKNLDKNDYRRQPQANNSSGKIKNVTDVYLLCSLRKSSFTSVILLLLFTVVVKENTEISEKKNCFCRQYTD